MCRRRRLASLSVVVVLAVLAATQPLEADGVSAPALTAAFLYNFAKFAEWPADALAPKQRLSLCVVGDDAVADALEQTIKGRTVEGHELSVGILKSSGPFTSCHLLYIGGRDTKRSLQALEALKGTSVFAVGEADGFAESGGIAQLILENDKMRFAINIAAAQRARLQLSSKLLSLATIINEKEAGNVRR